jgi:molybdenum cofactor cytidylyltransferase
MISVPYKSLAGVILAAGGSSRLGQPKQLCEWEGKPLICHAVETSLAICGADVIVVTGAYASEVEASIHSYPVRIVRNPDWQAGMSVSLQAGIEKLRDSQTAGVLVMLCDQPFLNIDDLTRLVSVWQTSPEEPAASLYKGVKRVPAIFPEHYLPALMTLQGDTGARSLLDACPTVSSVEIPSAVFDVDTAEDLARLNNHNADINQDLKS